MRKERSSRRAGSSNRGWACGGWCRRAILVLCACGPFAAVCVWLMPVEVDFDSERVLSLRHRRPADTAERTGDDIVGGATSELSDLLHQHPRATHDEVQVGRQYC